MLRRDQVKCRVCFVRLIIFFYLLVYFAVDVVGFSILASKGKIYLWEVYYLIASFIVLNLIYTIVILHLNRVMTKMAGDFGKEIRSVKWQFLVFFFAYLGRCVYLIALISNTLKHVFGTNAIHTFYFVLAFTCELFPTFTILLLHHMAFNRRRLD